MRLSMVTSLSVFGVGQASLVIEAMIHFLARSASRRNTLLLTPADSKRLPRNASEGAKIRRTTRSNNTLQICYILIPIIF